MITPTIPMAQAAIANFIIASVNITLEPALSVIVYYGPSDAQGNPTGPATPVQLSAAALTTLQSTAGSFKAKLYAALQTQVPALAGAVT